MKRQIVGLTISTLLFANNVAIAQAATLRLSEPSGDITAGSQVSLDVILNTQGAEISVAEAVLLFENTPLPGFTFTPINAANLSEIPVVSFETVNSLTSAVSKYKTDPTVPYTGPTANNGDVWIGNYSFTAPAGGELDVSFDPRSAVMHKGTDLLSTLNSYTYTFVGGNPSVTPVPSSTPTPIPSITPSPGVPTNTPTPQATLPPDVYRVADINKDRKVDPLDYAFFLAFYDQTITVDDPATPYDELRIDMNSDGIVNALDYTFLYTQWTGEDEY